MSQLKIFMLIALFGLTMSAPVLAQDEAAPTETEAAAPTETVEETVIEIDSEAAAETDTEVITETAAEPASNTTTSYEIDASHSTLGFAVKHLAVGTTRGGFNTYEGSVIFDPNDYSSFEAIVTIDANTIDTNNEGRDKHLRSPEFFDTEKFPEISFYSDRLEKRGEGNVIIGTLTMKGISQELTIPVELSGPVMSPYGSNVIGIKAQIQINRQDYGVSFSKTMDNGGLVVADMVDLIIEIEAHHK